MSLTSSYYYNNFTHVHEVRKAMSSNLNSLLNEVVEDKEAEKNLNSHKDVVRTVVVLEKLHYLYVH